MTYVPYQNDEVEDRGWGCAWRTIQMIISTLMPGELIKFRWLFSFFGKRTILEDIYLNMHQLTDVPQYLTKAKYAPFELDSGWAEPFIGHLVFYYLGWRTELLLVNGYPASANAPKEVFKTSIDFTQFT